MSGLQVPFGQRLDGRLVEVSQVERGLACNCRCPACGERLLAKKGAVNVQHFSHASGSDCATGAETALHLAAKQLVADKRWIRLPTLEVTATRSDSQCGLFVAREVFGRGETWRFDRVELEQAVGEVRPDALGFIGDVGNGVEVRVTHEVDADKRALLARLQLPCIEVNLAPLVGKVFTFEALEAAVIASVENKHWLYHPRQVEWEALLLSGFDEWRQGRLADIARREAQAVVRTPAPPPNRNDEIRAANQRYRALPDSTKWARLERELGIERGKFPGHLRVTLREASDVVLADKDLWQGALFSKFVLGAPTEARVGQRMPNDEFLGRWLAQRFGVKNGEAGARPAARAYLNYLKACGFLRWRSGDLYVAHSQLHPPPKEPPPSPQGLATSIPVAPACVQWSDTWPDDERLRMWAAEASKDGDGFDADWFVGWLLRLDAPPALDEVQRAFAAAKGNPAVVTAVLRSLGVVTNTWRYFSYGEAAPWVDA